MPRRQTIITGKSLNDLWNVGAKHALYREDGKWYHNLIDFPGVLFDSSRVKIVHNYCCQICGYTLDLGTGKLDAESHHIKPLGEEHQGPDTVENIMCVCPNHHALLDYGAIPINLKVLRITSGHAFNEQYIEYHNAYLYKRGNGSIVAPRS